MTELRIVSLALTYANPRASFFSFAQVRKKVDLLVCPAQWQLIQNHGNQHNTNTQFQGLPDSKLIQCKQ